MHKNNFDFLRLIFAIFVVITHSYPLSGVTECDWMCQLTGGQTSFSYIGVRGFFIISGYLILQSLLRSKDLIDYYWKRFLRLYPALFVVLFLTVLLAPLIYDHTVSYLSNKQVYAYFFNNLTLLRIRYSIDGIFEFNPYRKIINGSLWTISYEVMFYIIISSLIIIRNKLMVLRTVLLLLFVGFYVCHTWFLQNLDTNFIDLGLYFIAGSLLASLNIECWKFKRELLIVGFLFILIALWGDFFKDIKFLSLPFVVLICGIHSTRYINNISKSFGDLSYGLYIYAFPVQQTLMYYFKFNYLELLTSSLIICIVLSYLSWHLIEKRALMLKSLYKKKV